MNHLSDNELVELLEGGLPADRRAAVLAELAKCPTCRELARDWAGSSVRFAATPQERSAAARVAVPESATVGPYVIEELIGAGAMGLVFRARDPALDRAVAIKLVPSGDGGALAEGRLLATVRHPNVIAAHAAGTGDGVAYLVMELVDGTSLDRLLAERDAPVPWRRAVTWFAGVADGLAAAHAAGVVHRDIKPANLLLDRDALRVADFGLASTGSGAPAGTLAYAAPEVVEGGAATPASDQFSFFATLFEAVAKRRPFRGATTEELRAAWRAPVNDWPRMPAALRRIIARGLSIDPAARWPDMATAARALRGIGPRGRWVYVAGPAAVLALAMPFVISRAADTGCAAPAPGWAERAPGALRAIATTHEGRWRDAYARTCTGRMAPQQRACLVGARARVDGVLAALGPSPDVVAMAAGAQALASEPPPERCLSQPDVPPASASTAAMRTAEAFRALGRSQDALDALPPEDADAGAALLRGQIEKDLQHLDAAEAALRRAATLAARDDQLAVLADAQLELALVVGFLKSSHDAGDAYVDAALATATRLGDPRRAAQARIMGGAVSVSRGNVDAGIAAVQQGLDELATAGGTSLELATAELRLGWVLGEARRSAEARVHFDRALAARKAALGPDHPLVAFVETEIGLSEAREGNYASAIARYRSIIERFTPTLGDTHPVVNGAWAALGVAQVQTGDYAGAEASFGASLAAKRKLYGERHVDVVRGYINLASTQYYEGKYDDALVAYRAALATARSMLGNHPDVAAIENGIALSLQASNRLAEAGEASARAIEIYRAQPGNDAALADALQTRGVILLAGDDLTGARAALEESLAIQESLYGKDHVELASVLSSLSELYIAVKALPDAERTCRRALDLRTSHGVAPQLVAESEFILAEILWARGKRADAKALARTSLTHLGDARPDLRGTIEAWIRKPG